MMRANQYNEKKTPRFMAGACFIVGLIWIIIGLPLALNLVEPNSSYGIRIEMAFESDESWYAVNKLGGIGFIALGFFTSAFGSYCWKLLCQGPSSETARLIFASCFLAVVLLPTLLLAFVIIVSSILT